MSDPVTGARPARKLISVVAPVYFEEAVIEAFYTRLRAALEALADRYDHEILFVNDGSTDRSLEILRGFAAADPSVRVLDLSRNFGHQMAITAGMDEAAGDAVVVLDADLQDPPEVIAEMLAKWEAGYQVVYAVRERRKGESRLRLWVTGLFYRFLRSMSEVKPPVDTGDFRLLDRQVLEVLKGMREHGRYLRGLVTWVGFRQYALPYVRDARYAGEAKYTLAKLAKLALDGITSFSERPLYVAGYAGLFLTSVSFLFIVWVLAVKLLHPEAIIQGWTSLMIVVLFMGGIQLLFVGLLGLYLGRVFTETKGRPLYVIAQRYGADRSAPPSGGNAESGREYPADESL